MTNHQTEGCCQISTWAFSLRYHRHYLTLKLSTFWNWTSCWPHLFWLFQRKALSKSCIQHSILMAYLEVYFIAWWLCHPTVNRMRIYFRRRSHHWKNCSFQLCSRSMLLFCLGSLKFADRYMTWYRSHQSFHHPLRSSVGHYLAIFFAFSGSGTPKY